MGANRQEPQGFAAETLIGLLKPEAGSITIAGGHHQDRATAGRRLGVGVGVDVAQRRVPGSLGRRVNTDALRFGDYDPASGRVIPSNGERLSIGSTSGAHRVFGQDSWQWLLLAPLSR